MKVRFYKNRVKFNCANYHHMQAVKPANCYNCANRDGYQNNLGGNSDCRNFIAKKDGGK